MFYSALFLECVHCHGARAGQSSRYSALQRAIRGACEVRVVPGKVILAYYPMLMLLSLTQCLDTARPPVPAQRRDHPPVCSRIATILQALHDAIDALTPHTHSDLKPSNIAIFEGCLLSYPPTCRIVLMLCTDTTIRLIDFGLARAIDEGNPGVTQYVMTRWYNTWKNAAVQYSHLLFNSGTERPRLFSACHTTRNQTYGKHYVHAMRYYAALLGRWHASWPSA